MSIRDENFAETMAEVGASRAGINASNAAVSGEATDKEKKEMLEYYDADGYIAGTKSRYDIHNEELLHKSVRVCLIADDKIWLQKRAADKKLFPGKLDQAVTGHVDMDEVYIEAAVRESAEEISLSPFDADISYAGELPMPFVRPDNGKIDNEIAGVFTANLGAGSPKGVINAGTEISGFVAIKIDDYERLVTVGAPCRGEVYDGKLDLKGDTVVIPEDLCIVSLDEWALVAKKIGIERYSRGALLSGSMTAESGLSDGEEVLGAAVLFNNGLVYYAETEIADGLKGPNNFDNLLRDLRDGFDDIAAACGKDVCLLEDEICAVVPVLASQIFTLDDGTSYVVEGGELDALPYAATAPGFEFTPEIAAHILSCIADGNYITPNMAEFLSNNGIGVDEIVSLRTGFESDERTVAG